jgi:hypothetical protein
MKRKLDLILNWTAFKILCENIESRGFRDKIKKKKRELKKLRSKVPFEIKELHKTKVKVPWQRIFFELIWHEQQH